MLLYNSNSTAKKLKFVDIFDKTKTQPMKTTKKITINPARLQWCCEAIDVNIDHLS